MPLEEAAPIIREAATAILAGAGEAHQFFSRALLVEARRVAITGDGGAAEALARRAVFVLRQRDAPAAVVAEAERDSAAIPSLWRGIAAASGPEEVRLWRIEIQHTLRRYQVASLDFIGSGGQPLLWYFFAPAWADLRNPAEAMRWAQLVFADASAALTAREPADANFLDATSAVGTEPSPADLAATDFIALFRKRVWEESCAFSLVEGKRSLPLAPTPFARALVRLHYATGRPRRTSSRGSTWAWTPPRSSAPWRSRWKRCARRFGGREPAARPRRGVALPPLMNSRSVPSAFRPWRRDETTASGDAAGRAERPLAEVPAAGPSAALGGRVTFGHGRGPRPRGGVRRGRSRLAGIGTDDKPMLPDHRLALLPLGVAQELRRQRVAPRRAVEIEGPGKRILPPADERRLWQEGDAANLDGDHVVFPHRRQGRKADAPRVVRHGPPRWPRNPAAARPAPAAARPDEWRRGRSARRRPFPRWRKDGWRRAMRSRRSRAWCGVGRCPSIARASGRRGGLRDERSPPARPCRSSARSAAREGRAAWPAARPPPAEPAARTWRCRSGHRRGASVPPPGRIGSRKCPSGRHPGRAGR